MDAVIGLLVMILGVSHGVITHCDGRQDGAQCFGPLEGTVALQLMDNALEKFRYRWRNKAGTILFAVNNQIKLHELKNRSFFTPSDGTFRISDLSWNDGGEYKLEIFDSEGLLLEQRTLQLTIEAPVSSVLLVSECLSQGEMRVSCSSEGGDGPQYSWTLDGRTLTDAELLSGNTETNSITLKQHVSGQLVCSVRNNVSRVSEEKKISDCGVITHCDGRQDGAQCFGPLGGTVSLQLMDNALKRFRYRWTNKAGIILFVAKNHIVSNVIRYRSFFTPSDGTFSISDLSWNDGGKYKLEIVDPEKETSEQRTLQLTIEAPVSSVLLVSECLSQGEMRVSCSSEGGDGPQYSWTLDGRTLTDAELLSGNTETNSITLKQHVSGQLVCSVRNNVSRVSEEKKISDCGFIFINCTTNSTHISLWVFAANNTLCIEPTTVPTTITEASTVDHSRLICGVRAAVVILALIGISVYFAWKKRKYKMAEGSAARRRIEHQENSVVMVEMRNSASELYYNFAEPTA